MADGLASILQPVAPILPVALAKTLWHSQQLLPLHHTDRSGPAKTLRVFGNDYPTPDGTGIRDYLHVMDFMEAHTTAVEYLSKRIRLHHSLNLGTGQGLMRLMW